MQNYSIVSKNGKINLKLNGAIKFDIECSYTVILIKLQYKCIVNDISIFNIFFSV